MKPAKRCRVDLTIAQKQEILFLLEAGNKLRHCFQIFCEWVNYHAYQKRQRIFWEWGSCHRQRATEEKWCALWKRRYWFWSLWSWNRIGSLRRYPCFPERSPLCVWYLDEIFFSASRWVRRSSHINQNLPSKAYEDPDTNCYNKLFLLILSLIFYKQVNVISC